jgi:phosphatidylinositol alpha-1,6-mannosyltransferase
MAQAVLVSSSFLPGRGGIESYLAELCDHLQPEVAVVAAAERDGARLDKLDLPYPTYGCPGRLLFPGARARRAVRDAAKKESTDRVLFGTPWPLVLMGPRLRMDNLRYAVIVHGAEMTVPAAVPGVRRIFARALAEAELLLPVSGFTAEKVERFIRRAGHRVPPIALLRARVDLQRFSPEAYGVAARKSFDIDANSKVVLCFGRLVRRKGVHRLIQAVPDIARRVPETVVVVAGTGPEERRLRTLARKLDAPVVFTGRVPEEQAPDVYAAADVFALPVVDRWFGLEMEGLGVVLLEAAACGVAAVTGRSGGTPEAVLDGKTGFVVDARYREALVEKIEWLLEHPERAREMGQAGRAHVEATFSGKLPGSLHDWLAH